MTAILGLFGGARPSDPVLAHLITLLHSRGGDHTGSWRAPGSTAPATLAVSRAAWEADASFAGPALVLQEGDLVVAADASLYYLADLERALGGAGVVVGGRTPGHYILAAYRAWSERCTEHLEGDFAFVLWDGAAGRAVAARDFGGKRPLFYAAPAGSLVVASSIAGVAAAPGVGGALDLAAIAADVAGLFAADTATCYAGVSRLAAGCTLVHAGGVTRVARHWSPDPTPARRSLAFADAAAELRALLEQATVERFGPDRTSVWLSGGWDSTAVFAAGETALARRAPGTHLYAVSISYPPGDPGREDELIAAAVERWQSPVHWLAVDSIPLLGAPVAEAAARDEPFTHVFQATTQALAQGSRAVGARVAFDGNGGDQLFHASPAYLADLLRTGRWIALRREWTARRLRGRRTFFRYAVQPLLSPLALQAAAWLRGGRPLVGHLDPVLPPWVRPDFARQHDLLARDHAAAPSRGRRGVAEAEAAWQLDYAFFPRVSSVAAGDALAGGVELRSPLLDRRVVEFALGRPREDRARGAETKRLLREAMRGLLPDALLAPRVRRTGMPGAWLARSLRMQHRAEIEHLVSAPLVLDELGIVDALAFRRAWARFQGGDNGVPALSLLLTLHIELWLRAR